MNTYYIVQKLESVYNDEIYDIQDGGKPVEVFKNQKLAQKACDLLNYKQIQGQELFSYGYDREEIVKGKFLDVYNEVFGQEISDLNNLEYDFTLPEMTFEQYQKLAPYIKIHFYEVVKCQGE